MKNITFVIAIAMILMAGVGLTSCESSTQKVDDAKTDVQDAKQDLKDAQNDANAEAQQAAYAEEWRIFKLETNVKIQENEIRIAELKAKMKTSGKNLDALYSKNVDALEQRNQDLKARLNAYDKGQSDWESFKREFNHDLDGLGQAFTDLTVNNKK
jgi:outer membrane murein-binding lipoprotein Lpp